MKLLRSLIYGIQLSSLTISEIRYCRRLLKKIFMENLSPAEYSLYRSILRNLYINCGVTTPLFREYAKMIEGENDFAHELSTLLLATMCLEDILIDDFGVDLEHIDKLFKDTKNFKPNSKLEELTLKMYVHIQSRIPEDYREKQLSLLLKLHEAQVEAARPRESELSFGELRKQDFNKGIWFPAFVLPYNPIMKDGEIKILKHFGVVMKYVDDLYDYNKDLKKGKICLFTFPGFSDKSMNFFTKYNYIVLRMVENLDYDKVNKERYVFRMKFLLCSCQKLHKIVLEPIGM